MRRSRILLLALVLVLSKIAWVSADYIQLYTLNINREFTDTVYQVSFENLPFQFREGLRVIIDVSGIEGGSTYGYIRVNLDSDVIEVRAYPDPDDTDNHGWVVQKLYVNGNLVATYDCNCVAPPDRVVIEVVNSTAVNVRTYNYILGSYNLDINKNVSVSSSSLSSIEFYDPGTYTVKSVAISRFSSVLDSLTVVDENTNARLEYFDFVEDNDSITVFDPSGTYVKRTYFVQGGSLTAYLVKYLEGRWYTVQTPYPNATVQVLRNIGGNYVLVGEARTDDRGTTSIFLSDGVPYKFRVISGSSVLEAIQTTNPSNPVITLGSTLSPITVVLDQKSKLMWSIRPIDGVLYANKTNNITVSFLSSVTVSNVSVYMYGAVSLNFTEQVNTTSGEITFNVTPSQENTFAYLRVTFETPNGSVTGMKSFYIKPYSNTSQGLLEYAREVPDELGLSIVQRTLIATVIVLLLAATASTYTGATGGVLVAIIGWIMFTIAGWIDWRLTLITALAGLGFIVRRGEV
ncbi:hypothetical protein [Pyrococcus kukulkanii]|uniref:hypothetical protein n=1 Tax=Pyrococcus kukulkanii TaxID=1609559 RepID=UPI0035635036